MSEVYVVEKVIGRRSVKGKTQYLLKWENYEENESTWTAEEDCNCKQLIAEYERAKPRAQASSSSASTSAARSSTRSQAKTGDEKDSTTTPATGRLSRRSATSASAPRDKSQSPVKAEKTTTRETRRSSAAGKSSPSKAAPSSSDSEKEEEEELSTSKRPFGRNLPRKSNGGKSEQPKVKRGRPALSDDDEMGSVTGRLRRSANGHQSSSDDDDIVLPILKRKQLVQKAALEGALSAALLATPYHGRFVARDAPETRVPAKVFKAKELPGIVIWDRESYEGDTRYIVAASRGGDQFLDREVVGIVGYVEHPKIPFVLVKVGLKTGETTLRVTDAVQAVHCPLAERLFPKTYKEYMARVAQLSQPSGSRASASGAGPSGSPAPTPTGRTTRRSKE